MALPRKLGSTKRYGARYGKKLRVKTALIEAEYRRPHQCPSCHAMKAKRLSSGIWKCTKCKIVFTGRAYTTVKKPSVKEIPVEEEIASEEKIKEIEKVEQEIEEKA